MHGAPVSKCFDCCLNSRRVGASTGMSQLGAALSVAESGSGQRALTSRWVVQCILIV